MVFVWGRWGRACDVCAGGGSWRGFFVCGRKPSDASAEEQKPKTFLLSWGCGGGAKAVLSSDWSTDHLMASRNSPSSWDSLFILFLFFFFPCRAHR